MEHYELSDATSEHETNLKLIFQGYVMNLLTNFVTRNLITIWLHPKRFLYDDNTIS